MKQNFWLVILMCLISSGCSTLENFIRNYNAIPVTSAIKQKADTETVWVQAKTRKIWINPYVDDDGSMVEGHYKYIVLEEGHWAVQEITTNPSDIVLTGETSRNE